VSITLDEKEAQAPVSSFPIWTPWILVNVECNGETIQAGRAIKVGNGMTKDQAWETARSELYSRPDAVGMAVRRDG